MINMLKETFVMLLTEYTDNTSLQKELWDEIEKSYSNENRYYHTLQHLNNLLEQLVEIKEKLKNWETILFTLYYHDIIYNSVESDNEEKSARFAENQMKKISVPTEIIEFCKKQILATKSHDQSIDPDTNFFIDADLSILGQNAEMYKEYKDAVRKEYSFYPNVIYNQGRKEVLSKFLKRDRIFKTDFFYKKYEATARMNIAEEIEGLNNEIKL